MTYKARNSENGTWDTLMKENEEDTPQHGMIGSSHGLEESVLSK